MSRRWPLLMLLPWAALAQPAEPVDPEGEAAETMLVTGARAPQAVKDVAVDAEVITRGAIERTGAASASEVLQAHGAVTVDRSFRGAGASVGGLDARHTLVLIDGERATGRTEGTFDLDRIAASRIERIEIVQGVGSALYGADAIGGVINIVTRPTGAALSGDLDAQFRSDESWKISGHGEGGAGDFRLSLDASFRREVGYDLDASTPATDGAGGDQWELTPTVEWRPNKRWRLRLKAMVGLRDLERVDESGRAVLDRTTRQTLWGSGLRSEWRGESGTRAVASVRVDGFRAQLRLDQRGAAAYDSLEERTQISVQSANQVDWSLPGRHRLTVGADLWAEQVDSPRIDSGSADRVRGGLLAQDLWTALLDPYLTTQASARVDLDTEFGPAPTGKLALRYDPVPTVALRASAGLAYRAPAFNEMHLLFENAGVGYVIEGNPDLEPEEAFGLRLSATWQPSRAMSLQVAGFRTAIDGLINFEQLTPDGAPGNARYRYANVDEARTQGVETELVTRPWRALDLRVGYTWTDAQDLTADEPLEGRAEHRVHGELGFKHPRSGLDAMVRGSWSGERPRYPEEGVLEYSPAFVDATARLGWTHGAATVYALGENLMGEGEAGVLPLRPRRFVLGVRVIR